MNKRKISVIIVVIALIAATVAVGAETYEPGSKEDPVVTKSYVDQQIAAAIRETGGSSAVFEPLFIEKGKKLIGGAGAEIILRTGEAQAIDNGVNGISDVTGARDLVSGTPISKNHLLLIPREDGRGIKADTDIWVIIKGSYTIE